MTSIFFKLNPYFSSYFHLHISYIHIHIFHLHISSPSIFFKLNQLSWWKITRYLSNLNNCTNDHGFSADAFSREQETRIFFLQTLKNFLYLPHIPYKLYANLQKLIEIVNFPDILFQIYQYLLQVYVSGYNTSSKFSKIIWWINTYME